MIVPDEMLNELLRDLTTLSSDFIVLLKNLQPREGADVTVLLEAAKGMRDKMRDMAHTLVIVSEENRPTKSEPTH